MPSRSTSAILFEEEIAVPVLANGWQKSTIHSFDGDTPRWRNEICRAHNFEEILGNSPELLKLLDRVESAAPTDANVLIIGETGTGKEMIARAIHSRSARRNS